MVKPRLGRRMQHIYSVCKSRADEQGEFTLTIKDYQSYLLLKEHCSGQTFYQSMRTLCNQGYIMVLYKSQNEITQYRIGRDM